MSSVENGLTALNQDWFPTLLMPAEQRPSRVLFYSFTLAKTAILLGIFLILIHFFVLTIFIVEGASMLPNIEGGEAVLVNRLGYLIGQPSRGDVVVIRYPGDPAKRIFVKRVVGLPGEKVEVRDSRIFINGQKLLESYLAPNLPTGRDQARVLGADEYYTLGDNRPISSDSRIYGPTAKRFFVGKVWAVLYPTDKARFVPEIFY